MLRIIRTAKAISRNRQGLSPAWDMAEARKRKLPWESAARLYARARLGSDAFVLRRDDPRSLDALSDSGDRIAPKGENPC
jgi:hypothetical protein